MRVVIDGVGTFEVNEVALPQIMSIIEANKSISLESNTTLSYGGEQLINE